ncbi:MAG: hypothetical protein EAZ53_11855 [Bacteroidetes bacterium]|nr:MAG: hypothetical protein EAZ53_11855 [Bacteroidota bacterium]
MLSNFSSIFEIIVGFSFAVGIDAINKIIFEPVKHSVSNAYNDLTEIANKCRYEINKTSNTLKETGNQLENAKKFVDLNNLQEKNESDAKKLYEIHKSKLDGNFFENIFFVNGILFFVILILIGFENKHPCFCFQTTLIITIANYLFYSIQFFIYYKQIKVIEIIKIPFLRLIISYSILIIALSCVCFSWDFTSIRFDVYTISVNEIMIFMLIISSFFPYLLLIYISNETIKKIKQIKLEYITKLQNINFIDIDINQSSILS